MTNMTGLREAARASDGGGRRAQRSRSAGRTLPHAKRVCGPPHVTEVLRDHLQTPPALSPLRGQPPGSIFWARECARPAPCANPCSKPERRCMARETPRWAPRTSSSQVRVAGAVHTTPLSPPSAALWPQKWHGSAARLHAVGDGLLPPAAASPRPLALPPGCPAQSMSAPPLPAVMQARAARPLPSSFPACSPRSC